MAQPLYPSSENQHSPVLVLSVCWRTGSTLLQRLLCDAGILVWGEAGGALDMLEDAFERYRQMVGDGSRRYRHGFGGNGARQLEEFSAATARGQLGWIACMNIAESAILAAFRSLFDTIYAGPARDMGFRRWGIKEVQSGAAVAAWFRRLYPGTRIIVLARHPYDVLRSIKRRDWMDLAGTRKPWTLYARHWARLACELREIPDALMVRYEDLIRTREECDRIGKYVGAELRPSLITEGKVDWQAHRSDDLGWRERLQTKNILSKAARLWGYEL